MNHSVKLFNSSSKGFDCGIVTHIQLLVSNVRIGPILRGCEISRDNVGAVIKKGLCEGTTDCPGTAADQYVYHRVEAPSWG